MGKKKYKLDLWEFKLTWGAGCVWPGEARDVVESESEVLLDVEVWLDVGVWSGVTRCRCFAP